MSAFERKPVAEAIDKLLPVQPEDPEIFLADVEDAEVPAEPATGAMSDNVKPRSNAETKE